MNGAAIQTVGLSKRYDGSEFFALEDLSLSVKPGEVYGFLGPNGAGKSTTIRLLLNFIQPTKGSAQILDQDIVTDSVNIKKSVGYLAGEVALYQKVTGKQFLAYMAQLQPPKNKFYVGELTRRFGPELNKNIRDLSKGNRQKLGIIQAFMHEPQVLILDEPTAGLDPLMQEEFFKLLDAVKARGGSVFFSSHNLGEVQKICDRVGFIREGKLIAEQDVAAIARDAARTFEITFGGEVPRAELKAIPGAKVESVVAGHATIHIKGDLAPMFRVLAKHKVVAINQRELNLEAEFLKFYRGSK